MARTLRLQRKDGKPYFRQISDWLRERIESGELGAGMMMPSETALAHALGVSRMTVRAATDELVRAGMLVRHAGRGTIVVGPEKRVERRGMAHGLQSFSEEMRLRNRLPTSRVLDCAARVADLALAAQLDLAPGARVVRLKRLRLADGEPMALEEVFLPHDRFRGLLDIDFQRASLYEVLERAFAVRPTLSEEVVDAVALDPADAKALDLPAGSPALRAQRITRDMQGRPISVGQMLYRVDRYCMAFVRER